MIKADFIEEADLKKVKELKRFLSKNRLRLCAEEMNISFYGKGGNRWFTVKMLYPRNRWGIKKSMEIDV